MADLFKSSGLEKGAPHPLADRMRPKQLGDVVGQDHLLGVDGSLIRMMAAGHMTSLIFWGPPGTGKTTIARLLASTQGLEFEQMSAIFTGIADLKKSFERARARRETGGGTLLFVDEIHRFNRAQQDGFLPVMEDGTITLIGATTENPSFELNSALLSRAQVLVLNPLDQDALDKIVLRVEVECDRQLQLDAAARSALIRMADGDGRYLINLCELILDVVGNESEKLDIESLTKLVHERAPVYDKGQDGHYNLISALHKSVRGSDPDASLYWLARMLVAGEDPLYILRRVVRMAIEDVGLADPTALAQTLHAKDAFELLGSPEGELAIAQAVIYVATAPKSNAAYSAFKLAASAAKEHGSLAPPKRILNAQTRLMKVEGYGRGYNYDHKSDDAFSGQHYFPDSLDRLTFYDPPARGFEREIKKRLKYWATLRQRKKQ